MVVPALSIVTPGTARAAGPAGRYLRPDQGGRGRGPGGARRGGGLAAASLLGGVSRRERQLRRRPGDRDRAGAGAGGRHRPGAAPAAGRRQGRRPAGRTRPAADRGHGQLADQPPADQAGRGGVADRAGRRDGHAHAGPAAELDPLRPRPGRVRLGRGRAGRNAASRSRPRQAAALVQLPGVGTPCRSRRSRKRTRSTDILAIDSAQAASVALLRPDQSPLAPASLFAKIAPAGPARGSRCPAGPGKSSSPRCSARPRWVWPRPR